jgi:GNAT superfamily N-acetyltransferase
MVVRAVPYDHPDCSALTDEVQDYYESIYGGRDTSPVDPDQFAPPHGAFFVGYVDDEPVAMGGWRFFPEAAPLASRRPAEIRRMYVTKPWRGRGYARRLLAELESSARRAGADAMILETGEPQSDAIALYRSSGYADVARFGHYATAELAVHLGKRLDGGG